MAQLALGVVGAAVGFYVGGPTGAAWGWTIGSAVGAMVAAEDTVGPRLEDKKVSSNAYGQQIPKTFGTMRVGGQVVWSSDLIETRHEESGKGGGDIVSFSYSANCLLSVCRAPVVALLRIWCNGRLIYTNDGSLDGQVDEDLIQAGNLRIYFGGEDQLPDPIYEAEVGTADAVAYRGQCVVAFEGLALAFAGNRLPSFTFEVATDAITSESQTVVWSFPETEISGASATKAVGRLADGCSIWESKPGGFPESPQTYRLFDADGVLKATISPEMWVVDVVADLQRGYYYLYTHPQVQCSLGNVLVYDCDGNSVSSSLWGMTDPLPGGCWDANINLPGAGFAKSSFNSGTTHFFTDGFEVLGTDLPGSQGAFEATPKWFYTPLKYQVDIDGNFWAVAATDVSSYLNLYASHLDLIDVSDYFASITNYQVLATGEVLVYGPTAVGSAITESRTFLRLDTSTGVVIDAYGTELVLSNFANDWAADPTGASVWIMDGGNTLSSLDAATGVLTEVWTFTPTGSPLDTRTIFPATDGSVFVSWSDFEPTETIYYATWGGTAVSETIFLWQIVKWICNECGLTDEQIDVSTLTDEVRGYLIGRQMTGRAAIEPLQAGFFFDAVESAGILKFVKRGLAEVATFDQDDLGAQLVQPGTERDPNIPMLELSRKQELELPKELSIEFFDIDSDYDTGLQYARRLTRHGTAEIKMQVPIVFDATEGLRVAWTNLVHAWATRMRINFKSTHDYSRVEPTDAVMLPFENGTLFRRARIEQKNEFLPLIEWVAVLEDPAAYSMDQVGVYRKQLSRQGPGGPSSLATTLLRLMDVPPLRDVDDDLYVYSAMAPATRNDVWRGAQLFRSPDSGFSYAAVLTSTSPATLGLSTTVLGDWDGGNRNDDENTVEILLLSGTLSSASRLAMLNGVNFAQLGDELVQFRDVELVGTHTWRLSNLLRGRKGTERAISGHSAGEEFTLIVVGPVDIFPPPQADINSTRLYKAVSSGQAITDALETEFWLQGNSLKPLPPVHIKGTRDGGNNLTIEWVRRTRIGWEWMDQIDVPLSEASEAYTVDIVEGAPFAIVRTITTTSQSCVYTSAQQVTDFGSPQSVVYVNVYQMSDRIGCGRVAAAAI